MAKKFACGDVVNGCAWSITADNEEDLFKKIAEHARKDHGITEIPNDLVQKVQSKIQNA